MQIAIEFMHVSTDLFLYFSLFFHLGYFFNHLCNCIAKLSCKIRKDDDAVALVLFALAHEAAFGDNQVGLSFFGLLEVEEVGFRSGLYCFALVVLFCHVVHPPSYI